MNKKIISYLKNRGINQFRLVNHDIVINDYDVKNDVEVNKQNEFSYLFFGYNNHIYRLDYSSDDFEMLSELIDNIIKNDFWYCSCIELALERICDTNIIRTCKKINKELLRRLMEKYEVCSDIKIRENYCKMRVYSQDNFIEGMFGDTVINLVLNMSGGMYTKELSIHNPESIDEIDSKIKREIYNFNSQIESNMIKTPLEQKNGKCILGPEIVKMLLMFICNSLRGDQILFGSSFVSQDDFGKKFIKSDLSIFRYREKMDGEGDTNRKKYYIKNGELISAVNDIRTASYLGQAAGDTIIVPDSLNSCIGIDNIYISPIDNNLFENIPFYDRFLGNQIYFNQLTGEISVMLGTNDNKFFIHIEDNIISIINKIQCSVPVKSDEINCSEYKYGILLDL